VLIIIAAFVLVLASLSFSQVNDEFAMANNFYQNKDYDSAIRMYQSVLNQGVESAPLYFNLGNAYFKKGNLGMAVLNYLRARRLDPSDEDIIHNLEFAKQFSRIQMEGVELNPVNSFMSSIVDSYHLYKLAWLTSIFFIILIVILIFRFGLGMNNSVIRVGVTLTIIFTLIASGLTTYKYRLDYLSRRGVVINEDVNVYTGASPQSDIELEAAPGLIFQILDENSEYYNVLFENKRRGWVNKDLVAEI
jgi:tetratricopeptide (TPR) repeat protein